MGIFSFLSGNNRKNSIKSMVVCLQKYMLKYATEHPRDMDTAVVIFDEARMMIENASEQEIKKLLKKENIALECAALNILQNCTMIHIKPTDPNDFILTATREQREDDIVYGLFEWVNKQKLENGYISKKQFEENEHIGVMIRLGKEDYI